MQAVDQAFLLAFAGVAGTLLGTFVVGVFFYIDSEMHMRLEVSEAADRYQRSSIRWVFTAYSIALFVPLVFAALHPLWGSLAFGLFAVVLLAMTVDCVRRILAKGALGVIASSRSQSVDLQRRPCAGDHPPVGTWRMGPAAGCVRSFPPASPGDRVLEHCGSYHGAVRRHYGHGR